MFKKGSSLSAQSSSSCDSVSSENEGENRQQINNSVVIENNNNKRGGGGGLEIAGRREKADYQCVVESFNIKSFIFPKSYSIPTTTRYCTH